jgi:hypothetical protein
MDTEALGKAGLKGWRAKVGDAVAEPASRHTPLSADRVRAAIGGVFFVLSVVYVVGTLRRMVQRRRT